MTKDVLDSSRLIAMAKFKGDQWKKDYTGNPPLQEHVCIGYLLRHETLPQGKFNILLQGLCRARIVREIDNLPYRTAIIEPTESNTTMEIDLTEHRDRLEKLLADPVLSQLASISAIHNWLSGEIPTAALVDLAIMTACDNIDQRYAMLEEADVFQRARWIEHHLSRTRQTIITAQRFGSGKSPDGLCIN